MRLEIDVMLDYQVAVPADVLLQIEVAQMVDQALVGDRLTATSPEPLRPIAGNETIGQRTWVRADGAFHVNYGAIVELNRPAVDLPLLEAAPPRFLPGAVVRYLLPSRYIESDRFEAFVERSFGGLSGGAQIAAMLDWFNHEMDYVSGASSESTTAAGTFVKRQGVCRDYAHLLAAFARAASIPARLVSAYAPDVTPQDFHAVVEVWLSDAWHLVDATGMAKAEETARIAVGRDASDIAFMTLFGAGDMMAQTVSVRRAD